jgi:hypothetical protein
MPSQRSAYYNGTIQRLFNDCLFDVQITGEAAVSYLHFRSFLTNIFHFYRQQQKASNSFLMIDDLVEGATNIGAIERMFNGASARATEEFHTSSIELRNVSSRFL